LLKGTGQFVFKIYLNILKSLTKENHQFTDYLQLPATLII
jgi:hypothetical protein